MTSVLADDGSGMGTGHREGLWLRMKIGAEGHGLPERNLPIELQPPQLVAGAMDPALHRADSHPQTAATCA